MLPISVRLLRCSNTRAMASLIPFQSKKKPESAKTSNKYVYKYPRTDDRRRKPPTQLALRQEADIEKKTMYFDEIPQDLRNKDAFRNVIADFLEKDVRRQGHVEFIYAALKRLKQFGVHKDLQVYKDLLNVFPKGRFVAQNVWQIEFMHYPKHQECCIDILQTMEMNGVMPDSQAYHIVLHAFGDRSYAMRKLKRVFYWGGKFKHANPYPVPFILPDDPAENAKLALARMCPDIHKVISVVQTKDYEDAQDDTWIASCICPDQQELIRNLPPDRPLFVEGEFGVYLREKHLKYFILRDEPNRLLEPGEIRGTPVIRQDCKTDWDLFWKVEQPRQTAPNPSVHEQEDGNVLATCITGTGSKDSLLTWITYLSTSNPQLLQRPVLFRIRTLVTETALASPIDEEPDDKPADYRKIPWDGTLL